VALNFEGESWRPKRVGESPASAIVAFTVQGHTVVTSYPTRLETTWWNARERGVTERNGGTTAMVARPRRDASGYGELSCNRVQAHPNAKIFYLESLSTRHWAWITAPTWIAARVQWICDLLQVTVQWQFHSVRLTERLKGLGSQFFMYSLDPTRNCSQSLS
jgi:hypothetical protein